MNIKEIPLNAISVSSLNTRKDLDAGTEDANIEHLANSIRENGLLNPIIVRESSKDQYELIAGQRRFLACCRLGMSTIPATIKDNLGDTDATVISLIENVHRADMSPLDKARAYQQIRLQYGDDRRVAKETGVTLRTVRRYLSLLKLASPIQEAITTSEGPAGVGTLSKLAETFAQEDQERVLDALRGLRQSVQLEILGSSGGNLKKVLELKEQAVEGVFDLQLCREGLCFNMPSEWKQHIKEGLDAGKAVDLPAPSRQISGG